MEDVVYGENLTKTYGLVIGVNQLYIRIKPGITGLLGPNGAGKSTTLKMICGEIKPTTGFVKLFGQDVWDNVELKRRIGYAPEHDSIYPWMSAKQFVTSLGKLNGLEGNNLAESVDRVLKRVGLKKVENRKLRGFSKGMRQRIKLAQALVHDPEFLILDEPLNGLDPVGRVEMINLIHELGDEGKSILVSSHILHEVERMADQIVVIHQGRRLAEGKIHDIREMINDVPHTIKTVVDKPRELSKILIGLDYVSSIKLVKKDGQEDIHVRTDNPEYFYANITGILLHYNVQLNHLSSLDDDLESVFHYLVDKRRGDGEG